MTNKDLTNATRLYLENTVTVNELRNIVLLQMAKDTNGARTTTETLKALAESRALAGDERNEKQAAFISMLIKYALNNVDFAAIIEEWQEIFTYMTEKE